MVPNSRGSLARGLPRVGTQQQVPLGRASGQQRAGRPVVARGAKGRNCKSSVVQFLPPILIFFFFSLIYLGTAAVLELFASKDWKTLPRNIIK